MEPLTLTQIRAKTDSFQSILTHSLISGTVAQVLFEQTLAPGARRQTVCVSLPPRGGGRPHGGQNPVGGAVRSDRDTAGGPVSALPAAGTGGRRALDLVPRLQGGGTGDLARRRLGALQTPGAEGCGPAGIFGVMLDAERFERQPAHCAITPAPCSGFS